MKLGHEKNTFKQKIRNRKHFSFFPLHLLPVVFVLELGHRHRFESLRRNGRMFIEVFQLLLAQVVDEAGADRVAQDVDGRAEPAKVDQKNSSKSRKSSFFPIQGPFK